MVCIQLPMETANKRISRYHQLPTTTTCVRCCLLLRCCRTQKQALLHNDLHAGNLLVTPDSLHLIDWEFATYGPPAFDLGSLFANLLLARSCLVASTAAAPGAACKQQQQPEVAALQQQREWLLQVVQQVWEGVCRPAPGDGPSVLQVMLADGCDSAGSSSASSSASSGSAMAASSSGASRTATTGGSSQCCVDGGWAAQQVQHVERQMLADTLGFAGMCMVRQVVGMHHYQGFAAIVEVGARVEVERRCLQLGTQLLVGRQGFVAIPSVLQCVRLCDGL
jgi:5-methylthioribose kinase